ncbi:MAG: glycoside hydrolase family 95 protein, partial [Treponema sp.]|nr:glycoside hydrolase family 95 protein [Treponema sp.]
MSDSKTKLLWYKVPAENWIEALPVGNGRLGAMLYGGANRDLVSLNEDSIWEGKPVDKLNPKG